MDMRDESPSLDGLNLALPAFLSSVNGASELTLRLIPNRLPAVRCGNHNPVYVAASLEWEERCGAAVQDPVRAIAAVAPHSGDFLHAVPYRDMLVGRNEALRH